MRLHKLFVAAVLVAVHGMALAQSLPGAKQPGSSAPVIALPATPTASGLDLVPSPANLRGRLSPAPGSSDGGQHFHDELGWYRFTMPAEGTTQIDGTLRMFKFPAAGEQTICLAVRSPIDAFAAFPLEQIQAELETLTPSLEDGVKGGGRVIEKRAVFTLGPASAPGVNPMRMLAWDVRESTGMMLAYAVLPHPQGLLTFACSGPSADVRQEIIERFLRVGPGVRR